MSPRYGQMYVSPAINETLATRNLSEGRTHVEEEPSREQPSSATPPASGEPQIGYARIPVIVATSAPTPIAELPAAGRRNSSNSHGSLRNTVMEVSGSDNVGRDTPPSIARRKAHPFREVYRGKVWTSF